jgi:hypothetical protein
VLLCVQRGAVAAVRCCRGCYGGWHLCWL